MGVITTLSLLPSGSLKVDTPEIPHLDKWVHFLFYAIAMTLGVLFLKERLRLQTPVKRALPVMGISLVVYGMIIEVIQGSNALERSAEWWDVAANIAGIVCGAGLSLILLKKVRAFNWKD
jgi:membrane associated rhomboid family serine protease